MKILLHYRNWSNRWIPYIAKELSRYDLTISSTQDNKELVELSKDKDILFTMWANEILRFWTHIFPEKRIISYLRRYEMFYPHLFDKIKWDKVDDLIFVNSKLRELFVRELPENKKIRTHLIYNGIDLTEFDLNTSGRTGKKIAMICMIHDAKNVNFACQILLTLPPEYKIYHIGGTDGISVSEFKLYLDSLGLKDRFIMEGKKERCDVPEWLADKDFILSTSISEGNPVNVLEGMAMGLKPVIHRWPGTEDQFPPEYLFDTAQQATQIIMYDHDSPIHYRSIVEQKFKATNYSQLHRVINASLT